MSGSRARARLLVALALGALVIALVEASELGDIARTTLRGPYAAEQAATLAVRPAPADAAPAVVVARAD